MVAVLNQKRMTCKNRAILLRLGVMLKTKRGFYGGGRQNRSTGKHFAPPYADGAQHDRIFGGLQLACARPAYILRRVAVAGITLMMKPASRSKSRASRYLRADHRPMTLCSTMALITF